MTRTTPATRDGYDERANHILDAATRIIARDGYQKASMRAVARAAQVSLSGIYHYFDSKERLLFVIQFRTFNALLASLREGLHGVTDPLEQLHAMVRGHVGHFASNMATLRVCSHELDSLTGDSYEEIRRLQREYYKATRGIIDRLYDTYAPDSRLDRHVATMALFGTLNWLYRWYDPGTGRSPARLAQQFVTQFVSGTGASTESASATG